MRKNSFTKMKYYLPAACLLTSALGLTACAGNAATSSSQAGKASSAAASSTVASSSAATQSSGAAQADVKKSIVGKWILAEENGKQVTTNEKIIFNINSDYTAYMSASLTGDPDKGDYWASQLNADEVAINGNKVTITTVTDKMKVVRDFDITSINSEEFSADVKINATNDNKPVSSNDLAVKFVKVSKDYSEEILGTWEGHITGGQSEFDDGKDHRIQYMGDGRFIYFDKKGDKWEPGDDTVNEYFVDGNLLCTRWVEGGKENREWWEITIEGDKMNWTALRKDKDGKTSTVTFEMKKVN